MNDPQIHTLIYTSEPFGPTGIEVEGCVVVKGRFLLTKTSGFKTPQEACDYALDRLKDQIAEKLNCPKENVIAALNKRC